MPHDKAGRSNQRSRAGQPSEPPEGNLVSGENQPAGAPSLGIVLDKIF